MRPSLLFVYNADSGLFNTITDIAHKVLSPDTYACQLCALTHGHFRVREDWVRFLEGLDADCEFLHRDEFRSRYDPAHVHALPAIFIKTADGISPWLDADTLKASADLPDLKSLIQRRLNQAG